MCTGRNGDIPEEIIGGLAELGGFGLSVPEEYDGFASGGESDYMGMVVATEELSWGSLGLGGSLITRPEILTGRWSTGEPKRRRSSGCRNWPSAEVLAAVAVTEPDYGSDVANIVTSASRGRGGLVDQRGEDLVHLRRPGRRLDAAGPHRSGPLLGASRPLDVHRGKVAGRREGLRSHVRVGREVGGSSHRHAGLPGHALLRVGLRELVRARRQSDRGRGGTRQGLLPPDAGLRERPAANGGPRPRCHASGLRSGRCPMRPSARCSARPSATTN